MLVACFFCHRDADMALRLLDWIHELGGCKEHEILLSWNLRANAANMQAPLIASAERSFKAVHQLPAYEENEREWPWPQNLAWQAVTRYIADPHEQKALRPQPWLWLEPDCVPDPNGRYGADWLNVIGIEYTKFGKPFMGEEVLVPGTAQHLSGISVYPPTVEDFLRDDERNLTSLHGIAWDAFFAAQFLPYAAFTPLIQHVFWHSRNPDVEWHFASDKDYEIIRPEAALFHRDKEGKLIDRLQTKMKAGAVSDVVRVVGVSSDVMDGAICRKCGNLFNFRYGNRICPHSEDFPEIKRPGTPPVPQIVPHGTETTPVFTYFEAVTGIDGTDAVKLLELWKREWSAAGWNAQILTEVDARRHLMFPVFDAIVSAFPTINPPGYERACFLRWLAMAAAGGGFLCDYDVMPLRFPPQKAPDRLTVYQDHNPCPSLVGGTAAEFERICRFFMAWEVTDFDRGYDGMGRPHVSDMNVLQQSTGRFDTIDAVFNYTKAGWENAQAVHFASATMEGRQPRWQHIPEILKEVRDIKDAAEVAAQVHGWDDRSPAHGTWTARVREHVLALMDLVEKPKHRELIHEQMRKAGLLGRVNTRRKARAARKFAKT